MVPGVFERRETGRIMPGGRDFRHRGPHGGDRGHNGDMLNLLPIMLVPALLAEPLEAPTPVDPPAETAAKDGTALVKSTVLPERDAIVAGGEFRVAVCFRIEPGWHIYWRNSGDSGMPPSFRVVGPEGFAVTRVDWPVPEVFTTPDETTFGYSGDPAVVLTLKAPAGIPVSTRIDLRIESEWLVCKESCLMGRRMMGLRVPVVAPGDGRAQGPASRDFATILKRLPLDSGAIGLAAAIEGNDLRVTVPAADGSRIRLLPFETRGVRFRPGPTFEAVAKDGKAEIRATMKIEPDPSAEGPRTLGGLVTVTDPTGSAKSAEFTLPVPEPANTPASR